MKTIKVRTPAKINLTLELLNRMDNGYHNIASVMQSVNLFDYITISVQNSLNNKISISGTSSDIPYDDRNIAYKAAKIFTDKTNIKNTNINIFIEKNIPIETGLNQIFDNMLSKQELHNLASTLGSDLNFCLEGGACLLSSRGEIIEEKLPFQAFNIVILKPKNIAVSTKLCYQNYAAMNNPSKSPLYSIKIAELFKKDFSIKELSKYLYNDLESAVKNIYPELPDIKKILNNNGSFSSVMTGSGSAVFGIFNTKTDIYTDNDILCYNVNSIPNGVEVL